jgi:hypothetical protein
VEDKIRALTDELEEKMVELDKARIQTCNYSFGRNIFTFKGMWN